MTRTPRPTRPRPTLLLVALMWLTFGASGVTAWLWSGISGEAITRADDAGWDESLLLPHQFLLDVTCTGAFVLSLVVAVVATTYFVLAGRTTASPPAAPPRRVEPDEVGSTRMRTRVDPS